MTWQDMTNQKLQFAMHAQPVSPSLHNTSFASPMLTLCVAPPLPPAAPAPPCWPPAAAAAAERRRAGLLPPCITQGMGVASMIRLGMNSDTKLMVV